MKIKLLIFNLIYLKNFKDHPKATQQQQQQQQVPTDPQVDKKETSKNLNETSSSSSSSTQTKTNPAKTITKKVKKPGIGIKDTSKQNRIESLELVDNHSNENEYEKLRREVTSKLNETAINRLDDTSVTSLITYNPIVDHSPYLNKNIDIKLTIRYKSGDTNTKMQMTNLRVSIKAPIETILYNVLTIFELDDLDMNKYLLKIHGLEEYIPTSSMLGELKYINDCFNESIEPVFVLIQKSLINVDLSRRGLTNQTVFFILLIKRWME